MLNQENSQKTNTFPPTPSAPDVSQIDITTDKDSKKQDLTETVQIPSVLLEKLIGLLEANGQKNIAPSQIVVKEKKEEVVGNQKVIEYDSEDVFGTIEDMLQEPVIFFAYRAFHTVYDDSRSGACIQAPGGAIHFSNSISYPKQNPKPGEKPYYSICMAYVKSAIQAKFLREHSLFGIDFFEDVRQGATIDPSKQDAIARAKQWVSSLGNAEVKTNLIKRGKEISGKTIEELRRDLILESSREELNAKFSIMEKSREEFEQYLNVPVININDLK